MTRRTFLKTAAVGAGATAAAIAPFSLAAGAAAHPAQTALPRWRGFNLLHLISTSGGANPKGRMPSEDDFRWIADWGFDFVRIPMDYWNWIDGGHWQTGRLNFWDADKIKWDMFEVVDRTVELGGKHGLHVDLNLHRAPGYCTNNFNLEPFNLFEGGVAEDAFDHHWRLLAERYKHLPPSRISFNLVNEPPGPGWKGVTDHEQYARIFTRVTWSIRAISPGALIITDAVGRLPVPQLKPLKVAQSVHVYVPHALSHYGAAWTSNKHAVLPTWPMRVDEKDYWDRACLEEFFKPWGELAGEGIGVHCGETGCYNKTPHDVAMAWLRDVLEILRGYNIGWALWNLRGGFGVLDSRRADVDYEDWHGRKLDRKLLGLLQAH